MKRILSLRTQLLLILLGAVAFTGAVLLGVQTLFFDRLVTEAAQREFRQAALQVELTLRKSETLAKALLGQIALYPGLEKLPESPLPSDNIARFAETMETFPSIYALHVVLPNRDRVALYRIDARNRTRRTPLTARWLLFRYDAASNSLRSQYLDASFHPLTDIRREAQELARPPRWIGEASSVSGLWRDMFERKQPVREEGILYARKTARGGVVAMEIRTDDVRRFLQDQKFDPTATLTLFSDSGLRIGDVPERELFRRFETLKRSGGFDRVVAIPIGGKIRYLTVIPIREANGMPLYLGVSMERSALTAPYRRILHYTLAAGAAAMLLSALLALWTARSILRPVRKLTDENEKIKARRYDEVRPVETPIRELAELSSSLVAMSESIRAYERSLREMLESFIRLIADAIDAKSPYTGGHCKRVPVIAEMLAKEAERAEWGEFSGFRFENDEERKAFELGAWLHDCGKITTPEYVVDKATKLQTLYDRIHEIRTRFEVLWRDAEIAYLRALLDGVDEEEAKRRLEAERKRLQEEFAFVARCNLGSERMPEEEKERLHQIAERRWMRHFDRTLGLGEVERQRVERTGVPPIPAEEKLLQDRPEHIFERHSFDAEEYRKMGFKLEVPERLYNQGELYNLTIERGTLTEEERFKIEEHVIMTLKMLERIPYPEGLERIPEYAGTHHETMDGRGYPRRLDARQLSIPDRIMAVADIFEALTATDRPYKRKKSLSESLNIMANMVGQGHLDAEVFELFLRSSVFLTYAERYLRPEQIDDVDVDALFRIARNEPS